MVRGLSPPSLVQAQGCVGCTLGRLASSHCRLCNLLWSPLSAGNPGPGCQLQPSGSTFTIQPAVHSSTRARSEPQPTIPDPSCLHLLLFCSVLPGIYPQLMGPVRMEAEGLDCQGVRIRERTRPLFLSKAKAITLQRG